MTLRKVELHLTYRCDLACTYCNRGCRIRTDHTPDLTVEQVRELLRQAPPVETFILIGGEPTLHPEILTIARLLRRARPKSKVCIYSNAYRPEARQILKRLARLGIHNFQGTVKPNGSILHGEKRIFLSPRDLGRRRTKPCDWGATGSCGYSVDGAGITACAIGGAIDGILRLGVRTWDFREALKRLPRLCRHCGAGYEPPPGHAAKTRLFRGQQMTATWHAAATAKR